MAPPSRLAVATSSLQRLLKEELSYHKEVAQQEAHIQRLEQEPSDGDENSEFQLKQEVLLQRIASPLCQASGELIHVQRQAVQETKNIFPSVRQRILDGVTKLEQLLADQQSSVASGSDEEVAKAKDVLAQAKVQK